MWLNNFISHSILKIQTYQKKKNSLFIHNSSKICWLSWSFLFLAPLTFTRRRVEKRISSHNEKKSFSSLMIDTIHFVAQIRKIFLFSFPLFYFQFNFISFFGSFSWAMMTIFKGSWEKMNDIWWRCEITFSIISIIFLSFFPFLHQLKEQQQQQKKAEVFPPFKSDFFFSLFFMYRLCVTAQMVSFENRESNERRRKNLICNNGDGKSL